MDLLRDRIRPTYFKYLGAAFGSALISSIYGIVDMAMVGQYQGPVGTAALAVVAPVWNIIYSLGLLTGIGGSVLLAQAKGQGARGEQNQYFTAALILTAILAAVAWLAIGFFDTEMLGFFGAEEILLPLAKAYLAPVKYVVPAFLLNQMLAAFLRNDQAPGLATAAVLIGGVLNIFGDYFCVFILDMGIKGAGLATAVGAVASLLVMLTHFKSKQNTLGLCRPIRGWEKVGKILRIGFSTFIIDVAMGVLTILFNRQIMNYSGTNALSIYGVIVNISTIVQCCAYSVGQAGQPLLATNFGAGQGQRVKATLRYMIMTAFCFGVVWTACIFIFPNGFIHIFMKASPEILQIAPGILRMYGLSFLLLPINVCSTYYFQSVMHPGISLMIASARGIVVSGILIYVLPALFGANALWLAMPVTELLTMGFVIAALRITIFTIL